MLSSVWMSFSIVRFLQPLFRVSDKTLYNYLWETLAWIVKLLEIRDPSADEIKEVAFLAVPFFCVHGSLFLFTFSPSVPAIITPNQRSILALGM